VYWTPSTREAARFALDNDPSERSKVACQNLERGDIAHITKLQDAF